MLSKIVSLAIGMQLAAATVTAPAHGISTPLISVTSCAASGAGSLAAAVASTATDTNIEFAIDCAGDTAIELNETINIDVPINLSISAGNHAVELTRTVGFGDALISVNDSEANVTLNRLTLDGAHQENVTAQVISLGGLYLQNSNVLNSKTDVGALFQADGSLVIDGGVFSGNSTTSADTNSAGSVVYSSGGKTTISNARFTNNSAVDNDILYFADDVQISQSTFHDNFSARALVFAEQKMNLTNVAATGRAQDELSSAANFIASDGIVRHSTFVDARADESILFLSLNELSESTIDVAATIFGGGGKDVMCDGVQDLGFNLSTSVACISAASSAVVTSEELDLQPLAVAATFPTNTSSQWVFSLGENSRAQQFVTVVNIDGWSAVTTDARGITRGRVTRDAGAVEYTTEVVVPPTRCTSALKSTILFARPTSTSLTTAQKSTIKAYVRAIAQDGCNVLYIDGFTKKFVSKTARVNVANKNLVNARIAAVRSVVASMKRAGISVIARPARSDIAVSGKTALQRVRLGAISR